MHTNTEKERSGGLESIQVEIRPNQPTFGPAGPGANEEAVAAAAAAQSANQNHAKHTHTVLQELYQNPEGPGAAPVGCRCCRNTRSPPISIQHHKDRHNQATNNIKNTQLNSTYLVPPGGSEGLLGIPWFHPADEGA